MGTATGYGRIASRGISPVSLPTLVKVHHSQKISSAGLALGCPMSRYNFTGFPWFSPASAPQHPWPQCWERGFLLTLLWQVNSQTSYPKERLKAMSHLCIPAYICIYQLYEAQELWTCLGKFSELLVSRGAAGGKDPLH